MNYRLLSDDELVVLLKESNEHAFKELYLRYWKQVYQSAYKKIYHKEFAEELTQNLFVDLWRRRESLSINSLSAYLFGSLKFSIINHYKSLMVQQSYLSYVEESGNNSLVNNTDYLLMLNELSDALARGIALLPKKTAEVFRMSRIEHQSVKDISKKLNISEKAVEYHITQSLKSIRLYLKEYLALMAAFLIFF
ncbi:RNA polymerase sigma-70 factor (family 1) [Pedobacter africanus]|uniref:RNA polymerase sigma-70 factor (ECF subfamily) n=1 Tax=Pedobacter africanus TaxID=151894 RepID=A0ACC6KVC2_9SPHI|nr:sigma-70 family RNA polymerase sigma factor [Pedobacter africanus]MDR6783122.1 RNA polymerase sigma-70 factor (ECF subfamily) [Pedobacter africanus]